MAKSRTFMVVVATLLMGCGNSFAATLFSPPTIPTTLSNIDSRREYLALHYWDNFNFNNAELFKDNSLMGMAIAGYIQVLMMNPPAVIEKSVDTALSSALKCGYDPFEQLTSKFEDYLYNPNSPIRNEELYIYFLRFTVEKSGIDDIYRLRSRRQLEMALKNRIGEVATDFEYDNRSGRESTLHAITTPYTIILFNTPDCDDCIAVKRHIGASNHLNEMVDRGELTILAIYADNDLDLWRKTSYPSNMVNGADTQGNIHRQRLYDLKALPTLYLLDKEKKILLKDRTIEEIEQYITRN